jgi:hypothetical protein
MKERKQRQVDINVSTVSPTTDITRKRIKENHTALSKDCQSLKAVLTRHKNNIES